MKCEHDDCFTCPYPDCVMGVNEVCYDQKKIAERRAKRKEYQRQYYLRKKARKEKAHDKL